MKNYYLLSKFEQICIYCISPESDLTKATATLDEVNNKNVVHNKQLNDIQTTNEIVDVQTSRSEAIVENRQVV